MYILEIYIALDFSSSLKEVIGKIIINLFFVRNQNEATCACCIDKKKKYLSTFF